MFFVFFCNFNWTTTITTFTTITTTTTTATTTTTTITTTLLPLLLQLIKPLPLLLCLLSLSTCYNPLLLSHLPYTTIPFCHYHHIPDIRIIFPSQQRSCSISPPWVRNSVRIRWKMDHIPWNVSTNCMYACMYVCMYVCMHVCMYVS